MRILQTIKKKKITCFNCHFDLCAGVISSTEGTVIINGQNVKDDLDEVRMNLGLCPQENMMFPDLTPLEQVRLFGLVRRRRNAAFDLNFFF